MLASERYRTGEATQVVAWPEMLLAEVWLRAILRSAAIAHDSFKPRFQSKVRSAVCHAVALRRVAWWKDNAMCLHRILGVWIHPLIQVAKKAFLLDATWCTQLRISWWTSSLLYKVLNANRSEQICRSSMFHCSEYHKTSQIFVVNNITLEGAEQCFFERINVFEWIFVYISWSKGMPWNVYCPHIGP